MLTARKIVAQQTEILIREIDQTLARSSTHDMVAKMALYWEGATEERRALEDLLRLLGEIEHDEKTQKSRGDRVYLERRKKEMDERILGTVEYVNDKLLPHQIE